MLVEPISVVLGALIVGIAFGGLGVPNILEKCEYIFCRRGDRMALRRSQERKMMQRQARRTEVFRYRLKTILESVEDASKSGKNHLIITSLEGCPTDEAIFTELKNRKFQCYKNFPDAHGMRISWS